MATEEIEISELEFTEELASDNLIPVESSTDTKATSLQILKNWLSSFFVGKTGDETIGGVKIFTGAPILRSASMSITSGIDSTQTPPQTVNLGQINMYDVNSKLVGGFFMYKNPTAGIFGGVRVFDSDGNEKSIRVYADGATSAPTPSATSNTTHIATTAWVRNNISGFYNWGSLVNAGAYDGVYTAPSNGLLGICRTSATDWANSAFIYSGTTTSTTVVGAIVSAYQYSNGGSAAIPVKKGEQHYVKAPNGSYLFFVPQA